MWQESLTRKCRAVYHWPTWPYHTCITHKVAAALMALTFSEFTGSASLCLAMLTAGWECWRIKPSQSRLQPMSRGSWCIDSAATLLFRKAALESVFYTVCRLTQQDQSSAAHSGHLLDIILFIHYLSYPVLLLPSSSPDPTISISWDHFPNNPFVNESLSQGLLLEGS